ncbi:MAG: hypothetical protein J0I42_09730 [Bosea sp.]|uniref:hypothetical protein n=1 Tax=Bosea sp. (in: a-proteobacteria) TaxID=1871050 RepID=UPI001AC1ABED|nr:hypothetical protein [Bosea sp. (in: a-proteobacteria)]MBN9452218.1 hypothetical protein [Bosea sp. (in: a-proteobacteria)]
MSSDIEYFDVEERRKEKARARAEDDARIARDPSARAEIARRNNFFSSLDPTKMSISRRRVPFRVP